MGGATTAAALFRGGIGYGIRTPAIEAGGSNSRGESRHVQLGPTCRHHIYGVSGGKIPADFSWKIVLLLPRGGGG